MSASYLMGTISNPATGSISTSGGLSPSLLYAIVRDSDDNPFLVSNVVLNSSGTAFTVDADVLDTDGNAFTIFS